MRPITTAGRWAVALLATTSIAAAAYAAPAYKTNVTASGTVVSPLTSQPVPRLLPASKFTFGSDGVITIKLKGVRDAGGNLVTTTKDALDPFAVSGDEYIVTVHAAPLQGAGLDFELAVPVELKNGAGKTVLSVQYLVDQGLNYLDGSVGAGTSRAVTAKSILVWAPSSSAIMSNECRSGALTRPNTAPSWVSGISANYWLPPSAGAPAVNPCTSGVFADVVGLTGIAVTPGPGHHGGGGGCQIETPGNGGAAWLLLLPAYGLLVKRRLSSRPHRLMS